MPKIIDLTGQRFGRLVALERVGRDKHYRSVWKCVCDCGNIAMVNMNNLRSGQTQSCGCLHKERFNGYKHGHRKSKIYNTYRAMKERCYNPNNVSYKWYGAKGIEVCDEWLNDFVAFYEWAITNGYKDGLTIDRIDSKKNYSPSNCRWVTRAENATLSVIEREKKKKGTKNV